MLTGSATAISDEEMSDVGVTSDVLPKKPRKSYKEVDEHEFDEEEEEGEDAAADTKKGANGGAGDDEDDEDEDLDEDEFVVEKIFSHYIAEDVRYHERPRTPRQLHARSGG